MESLVVSLNLLAVGLVIVEEREVVVAGSLGDLILVAPIFVLFKYERLAWGESISLVLSLSELLVRRLGSVVSLAPYV